jgi:hypothetical protein
MPQEPADARESRCNSSRVHHGGPAWLPANFLAVCTPPQNANVNANDNDPHADQGLLL